MSLKCTFKVVGMVQTNCYFLCNSDNDCILVDPGDDANSIINYVESKGLQPKAILLTHGHFDHIMAVDEVKEKYQIPVYAAEAEKETLMDTAKNLSAGMGGTKLQLEADYWLKDGEELELLGEPMRCLLTPGHTKGGMCFYFPKSLILFSGDTLFQQSVGRTDFPGGSMSELLRSIREKLFVLPEDVRVYPGHGLMTSISDEKMMNPFAAE